MKQFDCQETKMHVHEYLHKQLSEQELDEITAHLANCESCDNDYGLESLVNGMLKGACSEVPPAELAERVMKRIRKIQAQIEH